MSSLPLEGIRILDLSMWWSGPMCNSYLGALGAEVIKVESIQFPDGFRYTMAPPGEKDWWELGPQFNAANMNKLGLTLNLNDPEGRELFKDLVAKSDVVVENFSPRVMGNFGLTYEKLQEVNPRIIMVSMPAYGSSGPYRDMPGFAYTFEILSGIAQTNGYEGENPMIISGVGDVIASFHCAYGLLAALEYRAESGKGQHMEIAQSEACANLVGQPIIDASMNNRNWERVGNRHPTIAPQGVYPSKGTDRWVAISVQNDDEWKTFCKVIGRPELANDSRFHTNEGRNQHHNELDQLISSWTIQLDHHESATILQDAGISAGPVLEVDEMENDPFLSGMYQEVSRECTGTHLFPSWPVKFSEARLEHHSPAPTLGQHNDYVLKAILGLSDERIQFLEQNEIIGNQPLGAKISK
ncbi:Crotonobetainyl-CoA:carnitine CoA-transferase CaiB [Mesobacillus persicus]|uniref:Crotonobetainyl-CoA:carnitine CoA-transferase CaiB n=1 Tax=Mesobacillus persicus TaxID=930146 RepID=A0A1H8DAZ1_9BACI|nr:CoA transferase [Mesobacillus persicus]SEN04295.1 Crotonobetainyl-CoA:carnitine CoA-transferase CaiB [Mesobacillus persicus]